MKLIEEDEYNPLQYITPASYYGTALCASMYVNTRQKGHPADRPYIDHMEAMMSREGRPHMRIHTFMKTRL